MINKIVHPLPIKNPLLLGSFMVLALVTGLLVDYRFDTRLDAFFHDAALVQTKRHHWDHVALIALDPGVPGFVSRRQALPLYSLAAQRAMEMGATAVFLDAVLYEYDQRTTYATCIKGFHQTAVPHQFQWQDSVSLIPFENLSLAQYQRFFIARPQFAGEDDFVTINLMQRFFGETLLPVDFFELQNNTTQLQRLIADATVHKRSEGTFSASFRWMNLNPNAVIPKVTAVHANHLGIASPDIDSKERCGGIDCGRIRFSPPKHHFNEHPQLPVIPVSDMVGCESSERDQQYAETLNNKIVILQLTDPGEATDIKVTPMLSAMGSPRKFISGPQFLADAVETMMQNDAPSRPAFWQRVLLIAFCALTGVVVAAAANTIVAFITPFALLGISWLLCFWTAPMQLWPVAASFSAALTGTSLVIATHISMGTAKAKLMAQYIPKQIRSLLLNYQGDKKFIHKRIDAVILMSDIAKYSNVTSELEDPAYVFQLLNYYFEKTTLSTQEKYAGWLESYVGDMVCFYWPVHQGTTRDEQQALALQGAMDMANLQQHFFNELADDPKLDIPKQTLKSISEFIGAGIGVTSGEVMMGNLGPERGIQKFGCLGDPLNLCSRTESLTRHFNTEILITEELIGTALSLDYRIRKVALVVVKGRIHPVSLYAMGESSDTRFTIEKIGLWERWHCELIKGNTPIWPAGLEDFNQDKDTIEKWLAQGLLDDQLGCFILKEK